MHAPFCAPFFRVTGEPARARSRCGITTVRDAAGADAGHEASRSRTGSLARPADADQRHDAVDDRWARRQPSAERRDRAVGPALPGHAGPVCRRPRGAAAKVREVIRAGADVIKIASSGGFLSPGDDPTAAPNFSDPRSQAIVPTAAGPRTMGDVARARRRRDQRKPCRAGVRSIDHGTYLDEEAVGMMVERGTWLVPTLTAGDTTERIAAEPRVRGAGEGEAPRTGEARARRVPTSGRGGRERGDGHRLSRRTARNESPRAPVDGRERLHAAAGAGGVDVERRAADGAAGRPRDPGSGQDRRRGRGRWGPFDFATLDDQIEQVWKDGLRVV